MNQPQKKKFHEIEINKNNEKLRFSIEEITSYIIKKMVELINQFFCFLTNFFYKFNI